MAAPQAPAPPHDQPQVGAAKSIDPANDSPAARLAPATEPSGPDRGTGAAAPRPPTPDEIAALLADADARAAARKRRDGRSELVLFAVLVAGVGIAASTSLFLLSTGALSLGVALASLAAVGLAAFVAASAGVLSAPAGAAGLRRDDGEPARLAGAEVIASLNIAERVLDADDEPRLITRRDGVVMFANVAYRRLAEEAGVNGLAGLPPRIDRLFAQQGAEATKVFRLCRAAQSAEPAQEVLHQIIGLADGGRRRRFEVSTRPVPGHHDYIAWRLRELANEDEQHDLLSGAYQDYVGPILAVEKSGQIAWANAELRRRLGFSGDAAPRRLDDIVLGEAAELLKAIWRLDRRPVGAVLRGPDGRPVEAQLTAFQRGGVGEGFVCVDISMGGPDAADAAAPASADFGDAPFGVAVIDGEIGVNARIVEANRAFLDAFGGAGRNTPLSDCLSGAVINELAAELRRKSPGSMRPVDAATGEGPAAQCLALYARPIRRKRGAYGTRRTVLYSVDITERKRMELDHAHDQKQKAIGNIAGEVAHDFNNLLQVVLTSCEDLMVRHPAGDPSYADLVLIRENAQRAANLTKQLLAYSRKQTLKSRPLSVTDILLDFSRFLSRAVGEKVKVELLNGRSLPLIKVDRVQLETAIMNLAVNARDAMGQAGGRVIIRTQGVNAGEARAFDPGAPAEGEFVLIEVADTGPGVPVEIMGLIFDPFFTTKAEGKGTGLGLSTVQGVIAQMGGVITVANAGEEGADAVSSGSKSGAIFRIYLPAYDGPVEEAPAPPTTPAAGHSGVGRILVVEDEAAVRFVVVKALQQAGYEVEIAADGAEGLEKLKDAPPFDLVITDVMMPGVDGPTLIERARKELGLNPGVVFISGWAENSVREQLTEITDARFLQKPFAKAELGALVAEALRERRSRR